MPRGPLPDYARRNCDFDHVVAAAVNAGAGQPVTYKGIETPDRAADIRKGIYRCAQHRKVSAQVTWAWKGELTSRTANWPPDKEADGSYTLTITVFAKSAGRKHHVDVNGTDRSQWAYNPFARGTGGHD